MDKKFSVMDMVDDYTNENNILAADIFKAKTPEPEPVQDDIIEEEIEKPAKKERDWNPDESVLDDLPELKQKAGAVYDKSELTTSDGSLQNIADEMAKKDAVQAMDDLSRKEFNIEEAKKRRGYIKLQIPPGELQTRILIAASDNNFDKAQKKLDEIFDEVENTYPEFILERSQKEVKEETKIIDVPKQPEVEEVKQTTPEPVQDHRKEEAIPEIKKEDIVEENKVESTDTKVIIDKTNIPDISWSEEDIKKIKKSRTIELNIVEAADIELGEVEDIDGNVVDMVLESYNRQVNEVIAPLPASKYRASFTGLTYPEVLDLTTSEKISSLDGEWKKWSICFNHIKNPSIGAFEEYYLYKKDGKEIKVKTVNEVPENVEYHQVTKFEDFLRKTSVSDLTFMLWKILCATTRNQEIVTIDCKAVKNDGVLCGHTYDWVYDPTQLLDVTSIPAFLLEEMREVAEAATGEEVMKLFKSSSLNTQSTVKLIDSGFIIYLRHISTHDYLTKVYSIIKRLDEEAAGEEITDPTIISRSMAASTLLIIKSILVPKADGKYVRISSPEGIIKAVTKLNEVDWQTITEISKMSLDPYQFTYTLRDLVCPNCKNRSTVVIEKMEDLLFIIAQSLSSVQVTLKRD